MSWEDIWELSFVRSSLREKEKCDLLRLNGFTFISAWISEGPMAGVKVQDLANGIA